MGCRVILERRNWTTSFCRIVLRREEREGGREEGREGKEGKREGGGEEGEGEEWEGEGDPPLHVPALVKPKGAKGVSVQTHLQGNSPVDSQSSSHPRSSLVRSRLSVSCLIN